MQFRRVDEHPTRPSVPFGRCPLRKMRLVSARPAPGNLSLRVGDGRSAGAQRAVRSRSAAALAFEGRAQPLRAGATKNGLTAQLPLPWPARCRPVAGGRSPVTTIHAQTVQRLWQRSNLALP